MASPTIRMTRRSVMSVRWKCCGNEYNKKYGGLKDMEQYKQEFIEFMVQSDVLNSASLP